MSERRPGPAEPEERPLPPLGTAVRGAATPSSGAHPAPARRTPPAYSPWNLIEMGALACLVGGLLLAVGSLAYLVGCVLLGLGTVVISIGTIAEGIRVGARWVAFDRGE